MASSVLADRPDSERSTVSALQPYVLVGKQANRLLQSCIMLVVCVESSFGVNEEGYLIQLEKEAFIETFLGTLRPG